MSRETNNKEISTRLYILGVALAAGLMALSVAVVWPSQWNATSGAVIGMLAAMVILAWRFPVRLSPQGEASIFTVPIFMGVLLLSPVQAIAVAAAGTLISEVLAKSRFKVAIFNLASAILMTGVGGAVFATIRGGQADVSLIEVGVLGAAVAAGASLHLTNLLTVAGMVSIRRGFGFWVSNRQTWLIDAVQEGGLLVLGYLGTLLLQQAWWSFVLILVPVLLAYYAFSRSVEETNRNAALAEENMHLAKQLEARLKELQVTQAQLVQSAKLASVGVLAAGVAHEVNNPIFAISGRAELMLRSPDKHLKSAKAVEYVKSIHEMAQRVTNIVRGLLDYSRASDSLEALTLNEAMDKAVDLIGKLGVDKGVEVVREYGETPPVKGVQNQLQQVFINLLENAIDASKPGGRITLRCNANDGHVVASIKDDGVGIPDNVMPHMFEPFFTTKDIGKGTGLGLYICRKIVTAHGGDINILSKEGAGTEVLVSIPVAAHRQEEEDQALEGLRKGA